MISTLIVSPIVIIYVFLIYSHLKNIKGSFDFAPSRSQKTKYIFIALFGGLVIPATILIAIIVSVDSKKQLSRARDVQRVANQNSLERALDFYTVRS